MDETKKRINNFVDQLLDKDYGAAEDTLATIVKDKTADVISKKTKQEFDIED